MPREAGFTLIELLMAMVIIGILSTIAVSRFTGRGPFDELGYAQELATAARYAQKLALSSRCPVAFQLPDAAQYRLRQPGAFVAGSCATNLDQNVLNPANRQAAYAGTAPDGIAVSASGGFPATRVFSAQGDFDSRGGTVPTSDLTITVGPRTVTLRNGGQVVVQ